MMTRFRQQNRYPLSERPTVMLDCGSVSVVSGAVATLIDRSGNGRDFSQSTSANRPTYNASDANFAGQPTMGFDGANDALTRSTAYAGGTTRTIYTVFRLTTTAGSDARIYSDQTGAVSSNNYLSTDTTPYLNANFNNPAGTLTVKRQSISTNTVYRLASTFDPSVGSASVPGYYLNGTSTGSYSATAASNGSSLASGTHGVGSAANGTGSFFTGQIASVIDCASTHTTSQIARVEEYMRSRYQRNHSLPPIMTGLEFFGDLSSPRTSVVSGAVATLGDASGNNRDFTQATSTKRPTYSSNDANFGGRPSMTLDGVDDFLSRSSAFAAMSNVTIYIVHKGSAYGSFNHLFAIDNAPNDGCVVVYLDGSATSFGTRFNHPSGAGNLSVRDITGSATLAQRLVYSGALSAGGALWTTYLNGAASGANGAVLSSSGGASSTGSAGIGAVPSGSQNIATTFTDILVYSTAHSAGEVAAMDAWLRVRNGLT